MNPLIEITYYQPVITKNTNNNTYKVLYEHRQLNVNPADIAWMVNLRDTDKKLKLKNTLKDIKPNTEIKIRGIEKEQK
jgi:hypothetical protein